MLRSMPEEESRRYTAFLSYRHADNKEDGRHWAEWLHHSLETYEVPRDLVGRPNLRGEPIPSVIYPVFRDEAELPADAELSTPIQTALARSDTLIVLCSPRATHSRFVADEIRSFKEMGKSDRILALILDGEPNADDAGKRADGIAPQAECFPEPLRSGLPKPDGSIDWTARTEPIAADVRPGGAPTQGFTTAAAYRDALEKSGKYSSAELRRLKREYAARLELARLKLISGVLGVSLGSLTKRDAAYRARKFRRLASVLGLLFLLAIAAAAVAFWQRSEATRQRNRAERSAAAALEALASTHLREGLNRLTKPETSAEGLAYLAQAVRLARLPLAETRLWTIFQQRQFWLEAPSSGPPPQPAPVVDQKKIDPRFISVVFNGKHLAPALFARSADGRVCVTIVNGEDMSDTERHHFRVWRSDGTAITPWLTVANDYEKDVRSLDGAYLSPDGSFVAIVAFAWRQPEYLEIWNTKTKKRVGAAIEATGRSPHHQNVIFGKVAFLTRPSATGDSDDLLLLTASNRGDASLFNVSDDDYELVGRCSHAAYVAAAEVDEKGQWLMSASSDNEVRVYDLQQRKPVGHPFFAPRPVQSLQRSVPDHLRLGFDQTTGMDYQLSALIQLPLPVGPLRHIDEGKSDNGDLEGGPNALPSPSPGTILARSADNRRAVSSTASDEVAVFEQRKEGQPSELWRHRFSSPLFAARFTSDGSKVVLQTSTFTTEIWDAANGRRIGTPIEETRLFAENEIPGRPLLSMLGSNGDVLLTRSFFWDPPNSGNFWFTVWDVATGLPLLDRIHTEEGADDPVEINHAELSDDQRFLLLGRNEHPDAAIRCLQIAVPSAVKDLLPDAAEGLGGFKLEKDGSLSPVTGRLEKVNALARGRR
jgi:WD40 repeat protein